jgi:hypothetical protein
VVSCRDKNHVTLPVRLICRSYPIFIKISYLDSRSNLVLSRDGRSYLILMIDKKNTPFPFLAPLLAFYCLGPFGLTLAKLSTFSNLIYYGRPFTGHQKLLAFYCLGPFGLTLAKLSTFSNLIYYGRPFTISLGKVRGRLGVRVRVKVRVSCNMSDVSQCKLVRMKYVRLGLFLNCFLLPSRRGISC